MPIKASTDGGGKIQVLIVDDSASVRATLSAILADDPQIEVMGAAADPYLAAEKIRQQVPDVLFLDIEMPRMDGLTFLRKIMAQRPIPVVICSSLAAEKSDVMMEALAAGAVDVITKPRVDTAQFLNDSRMLICDVAKAAAHAKVRAGARRQPKMVVEAKHLADVVVPPISETRAASLRRSIPKTEPIVCIGASTGGTEALAAVLTRLPAASPAILIVQHMPENFTAAFARRLDGICAVAVKEAADGDQVLAGRVLIAPGNRHMLLRRAGSRYTVAIGEGPYVCRHRPSVDVMFRTAAQNAGANAMGVLLTGMGDDGARGLLEMRAMGSHTVAQDEETSIVFGMPREAIELGAVQKVMPLQKVAEEILRHCAGAAQAARAAS
ncbi:chemotaxis response regulator protein-glutamate methylesterase [Aurantimonas sp. 22II-16-19i]|uniref:protein-glutamate methylesterase/protein-glutamine glutaminase n=1 Tax=Aurantimonas sp. 22II-16-19i TaxID=1317114 RepID=UPI0009F7BB94|nr:chemotaxis response regulator protein-glutamate methylesterase [Aurantimonas sp. 22II-16-19i]ORE90938.1 chemotaxis response regulator protein-glutamate methylesterase CheB [Aurantimonas sp. 22II-16-19i]